MARAMTAGLNTPIAVESFEVAIGVASVIGFDVDLILKHTHNEVLVLTRMFESVSLERGLA